MTLATASLQHQPDGGRQTVRIGDAELTLRDITVTDMAAVLALHTLVFGAEVDEEWFRWKYGQLPEQGLGEAVGAWHNGILVAFCGGLPRVLLTAGQAVHSLQIGDVMVHPAWRGILTRRGPFSYVSTTFYETRLGPTASHSFVLGYGFPSTRHLRLAVVLKLLRDGGQIEALHWTTGDEFAERLPTGWRWRVIDPHGARFARVVNQCWQSMREATGQLTLGQRDAAYLRWRYAARPPAPRRGVPDAARYRFFELRRRWSMAPSGVAVLDLHAAPVHWLDWVGPITLMPLAALACRLEAHHAKAAELVTWASGEVAQQLAATGIARREPSACLGIPVSSGLPADEVQALRWWMMSGDTDFL